MKSTTKKLTAILIFVSVFAACRKDDHGDHDHEESAEEFRYVRLLVTDVTTNKITHLRPSDGTITRFDAKFPNATIYTTGTKRFAALLHGTQNAVEFFDSGLELHSDHVDVIGTPKFAAIGSDGPKPTHFKSRTTESVIFNDGDGTLSVANETDFHTTGAKMRVINAGLEAHHGAMAQFDNKTYAVTVFDKTSAQPGPHAVKIIDAQGKQLFAPTVMVSRLHGNATDGTNAVFGVEGGALVVNRNGEQRKIANPGDWGTTRLGTILEASAVNKFLGFVATKGVYFVDVTNNKINPILESTEIQQVKVDFAGKNLLLLMNDGTLKIYELNNGTMQKEAKVMNAIPAADAVKPVLEASSKYAYISSPGTGEVLQVNLQDLSSIKKIKVEGQPAKLTIMGFETNESH